MFILFFDSFQFLVICYQRLVDSLYLEDILLLVEGGTLYIHELILEGDKLGLAFILHVEKEVTYFQGYCFYLSGKLGILLVMDNPSLFPFLLFSFLFPSLSPSCAPFP